MTVSTDLDPRAQRSRVAMQQAIQQLIISEGISAVTHQRVAEAAGVSRATVYRHWATRSEMLLSVLELIYLPRELLITGPIEQRLRAVLRWVADEFSEPTNRAFIVAVNSLALHDADAARMRDYRLKQAAEWFAEGIRLSSFIETNFTPRELLAMLVGPIWMRTLIEHEPVSDEFIDAIAEPFLTRFFAQTKN